MKKKKHSNTPKRKRLSREQRLSLANDWLRSYIGKNSVKGYSKWFGVDLLTSISELRLAGATISEGYEQQIIKSNEAKIKLRKSKKTKLESQQNPFGEWDNEFDFIAGYTSNGVPYGIRKDEEIEDENSIDNCITQNQGNTGLF